MFDAYDPVLKIQKELTGIEGSAKAIRTGFAAKMKKSGFKMKSSPFLIEEEEEEVVVPETDTNTSLYLCIIIILP